MSAKWFIKSSALLYQSEGAIFAFCKFFHLFEPQGNETTLQLVEKILFFLLTVVDEVILSNVQ
jgi:hypothetical protein